MLRPQSFRLWNVVMLFCVWSVHIGIWISTATSEEFPISQTSDVASGEQDASGEQNTPQTDSLTPEEMYQRAMDFYYGRRLNGAPDSRTEYVRWLQKSAESGYASAQFQLIGSSTSLYYLPSDGVDISDLFRWISRGADENVPEAIFWKGNCYLFGAGVTQDVDQGLKCLRDAADQGEIRACITLARWYRQDFLLMGVLHMEASVPDEEEASKWESKAVELAIHAVEQDESDAKSCSLLGVFYQEGYGVTQDEQKSQEWMERTRALDEESAEQGDVKAMCAMGQYYSSRNDLAEAKKWYRQAAESGYWFGQWNLAHLLEKGDSSEKAEAVVWLRRAAEQGWSDAQYDVGARLLKSPLNPEDSLRAKEGVDWVRRAAQGGSRQAQLALGTLYAVDLFGDVVVQDIDESRKWFTLASQFSFDLGDQYLGQTAKLQLEALQTGHLLDPGGGSQRVVYTPEELESLKRSHENSEAAYEDSEVDLETMP